MSLPISIRKWMNKKFEKSLQIIENLLRICYPVLIRVEVIKKLI